MDAPPLRCVATPHPAHRDCALLAIDAGKPVAEAATRRRKATTMIGTASTVADQLQELFESGACDGFIVEPPTHPTSHEQFCRAVVPELQRRGLFRTEYEGATLRGSLLA
jgi:alkanesulfonate monooxygenase SsuD/methylene tetrahydromethanopterin reductase-like flavin-dependent oxidoreductase (luciferase family)